MLLINPFELLENALFPIARFEILIDPMIKLTDLFQWIRKIRCLNFVDILARTVLDIIGKLSEKTLLILFRKSPDTTG